MLNWLHLKNFQIHKDSFIEFSPGINFIKGETHNGKSSIIRALRLIAFNDPRTEEYMHEGKTTTLKADFDGTIISKTRSKSKNEYKVNNESPLRAFRTGVPEEVSNMLNLTTQNFQEQKEPYFLIQNTPSERMKILDNIAGFEEIKEILSNANKSVLRISSSISVLEDRIEEYQEQLKEYEGIEDKYEQVEHTLRNLELIKYYQNSISDINSIVEQINFSKKKERRLKKVLVKKPLIKAFQEESIKHKQIQSERLEIVRLQKQVIDADKGIAEAQKVVNKKEGIQQAQRLLQRSTELRQDEVLLNDLIKLDTKLDNAEKKRTHLKEKRKTLEAEIEICPICKKPF